MYLPDLWGSYSQIIYYETNYSNCVSRLKGTKFIDYISIIQRIKIMITDDGFKTNFHGLRMTPDQIQT